MSWFASKQEFQRQIGNTQQFVIKILHQVQMIIEIVKFT